MRPFSHQASVRYGDNKEALVIVHAFEHDGDLNIEIPIRPGYSIVDIFEAGDHDIKPEGTKLNIYFKESFDAVAILLAG